MNNYLIEASNNYENKHRMRIIRRRLRDEMDPFDIPEARFIELFRLPISRAIALIDEIIPHMANKNRSDAIPAKLKILAALNFYSSGSYQRRDGQDFLHSMSQTLISQSIQEVSEIFCSKLARQYINFPKTPTEIASCKQGFLDFHRNEMFFPHIIGCIDCGHIPLMALRKDIEQNYVNRKGCHSKNVQFICDANLKILNVYARFSGATHDAYIWSISQVRIRLKKKYDDGFRSFWLLGDSGYPLEPWLMTPYRPCTSPMETTFNKCHAIKRNTIERAIGLLKSRFRCCSSEKPLRYSPAKAGSIINACVVLHNILIDMKFPISAEDERRINLEMQWERQWDLTDNDNNEEDFLTNLNTLNLGKRTRNSLANRVITYD